MSSLRWIALAASLLLTGCPMIDPPHGGDQPAEIGSVQGENTSTDQSSSGRDEADVEVQIASWSQIEGAIKAHQGKVVVVDLWSTWCDPCKREFPGLVTLHRELGKDVACISVSLDYYGGKTEPPESFQPAVTKFLAEKGAKFENFICSDESDDVLNRLGSSAVPVVLVYDRGGKLATTFTNGGDEGFHYEKDIAPLVRKLAAQLVSPS